LGVEDECISMKMKQRKREKKRKWERKRRKNSVFVPILLGVSS
jgi:hypothetical protein